jgi:hypothetical protein
MLHDQQIYDCLVSRSVAQLSLNRNAQAFRKTPERANDNEETNDRTKATHLGIPGCQTSPLRTSGEVFICNAKDPPFLGGGVKSSMKMMLL